MTNKFITGLITLSCTQIFAVSAGIEAGLGFTGPKYQLGLTHDFDISEQSPVSVQLAAKVSYHPDAILQSDLDQQYTSFEKYNLHASARLGFSFTSESKILIGPSMSMPLRMKDSAPASRPTIDLINYHTSVGYETQVTEDTTFGINSDFASITVLASKVI